jgi:hypothetical protein
MFINWRKRAEDAEAKLVTMQGLIDGIQLRFNERAALMSITRNGPKMCFVFVRNNDVIKVEALVTWDDDVEQLKKDLLG